MRLPIRRELRGHRLITGDLDILRMLVLGGLRVIARAADDDLPIDIRSICWAIAAAGPSWRASPHTPACGLYPAPSPTRSPPPAGSAAWCHPHNRGPAGCPVGVPSRSCHLGR